MTQIKASQEKKPHRVELTQRDLDVLELIGHQYTVGFYQLQRILGAQPGGETQVPGILSESATRVWVARMKMLDAVSMEKPFRAQPAFVWLRPTGLRLAGLDYKYLKPALTSLAHYYWCSETRLYITTKHPNELWKSDRQLRSERAQANAGKKKSHSVPDVPDAELLTQDGPLAIEVELSEKKIERLSTVIYQRLATYYTTWYFCSDNTAPLVKAVRQKLENWQRKRVFLYRLDHEMREMDND